MPKPQTPPGQADKPDKAAKPDHPHGAPPGQVKPPAGPPLKPTQLPVEEQEEE